MKLVMIIQNATTWMEDFSEAPRLYTPSSLKLQTLNLRNNLIIYHRKKFFGWVWIVHFYLCNVVFVCRCAYLVKQSYWQQFHDCISIWNVFLFEFDAVCVCVFWSVDPICKHVLYFGKALVCSYLHLYIILVVCDEGVSHTAGGCSMWLICLCISWLPDCDS